MRQALVRHESLVEYFKRLVDGALQNQRVDALELTAYYLVQLLAAHSRVDASDPERAEPLALRLGRALSSAGSRQRTVLREVGDQSLFISGYFSDSLRRSLVDVDYYASLGGYAYASLSQEDTDVLAPVFAELADRFVSFVDILGEVSEASALTSDSDVLRLYERWARGSRRCGDLLTKRGLVPNAEARKRLTH